MNRCRLVCLLLALSVGGFCTADPLLSRAKADHNSVTITGTYNYLQAIEVSVAAVDDALHPAIDVLGLLAEIPQMEGETVHIQFHNSWFSEAKRPDQAPAVQMVLCDTGQVQHLELETCFREGIGTGEPFSFTVDFDAANDPRTSITFDVLLDAR